MGLRFENCSDFLFTADFDHCQLNLSSFTGMKLKRTKFNNSTLCEVDFSGADLSHALFENCDLSRAVFERSLLEKADFRTAYNFSIDPEMNKIKKAKFSAAGIAGLLNKYDIEIE